MPSFDLSFPAQSAYDQFEDTVTQLAIKAWSDRIGADLVLTIAQHRETGGLMIIPHSKWPMNHVEVLDILRTTVEYILKATEKQQ